MIPKNSRSRRKHLSPHDNDGAIRAKAGADRDSSAKSNLSEGQNALPTITRTSNHSSDHFPNDDNNSACSWVELDFAQQGAKGPKDKPVSHVNIAQYLVDDQESFCETNRGGDDNSSTTSNLSEDFSVDNNGKNADKGDDDRSDGSVTSYGSETYATERPFDDLLAESLRDSNGDLMPEMTGPPASFRSEKSSKPESETTKPASERSKGGTTKKHKSKPSKKVSPRSSKSPGAVQARKRAGSIDRDIIGEGITADEGQKELKKKHTPKKSSSSASASARRRYLQQSNNGGDETTPVEEETSMVGDESLKDHKKKHAPKKSSSNASVSARRRYLQQLNGGGDETAAAEDETGNINKELKKKHSPKSSVPKSTVPLRRRRHRSVSDEVEENVNGVYEVEIKDKDERKEERPRRTKFKSKSRKTPSRSKSGRNDEERREIRKRYKKKPTPGNESEEDTENHKSRQTESEPKKKIRSKSADSVETKDKKLGRNTEGKRRRRKRLPKETPGEDGIVPKEQQPEGEHPEEERPIFIEQQPDPEPMEMKTYSFHFRSDDDDKSDKSDKWLNSGNNSSSSSLSYNSFAQFSLDVGELGTDIVTDTNGLMGELSGLGNSCGFVPDLDASVQSVTSNHSSNFEPSVVFMAGKSKNVSLLSSHTFDHDDDAYDDNDKSRSARSAPIVSSNGVVVRQEKQLRRRLKKKEGEHGTHNTANSEMKKKVRRAKSGGVERLLSPTHGGGGKRSVERAKSHNEALMPGASKLVVSTAKKQERHEKSNRRKKEKHSIPANTNKPKHAGKSKSAHARGMSISPKNKVQKKKIAVEDEHLLVEISYDKRTVPLNDEDDSSPWRSPLLSPNERHVHRTFSNPCPSPSIHAVGNPADNGENSLSPMSYGSSPTYQEGSKRSRRQSISKQSLLSSHDRGDSDVEAYMSDANYSPTSGASGHKKRSFLPKRGLERTPSSMLAGVRNHFKEERDNMLSKMKKTFSKKDVFSSSFDDITIGITTERGYVGRNERVRKLVDSASRRGQVKNSLYACMSDDDSVEISSEIFEDGSDDSGHDRKPPKRMNSLDSSVQSEDERAGPRRVNSLPIGGRKS